MFNYEDKMSEQHENASPEDVCGVRCINRERIALARARALPAREYEAMAALFKAMGDPNRLRTLWALGHGEMCVCDLAAHLECSESAVSHQLRLLRQMALVSNRRQGQVLYYRLNDDHIHTLIHMALEHIQE
jgi:ArsR family transcriptional regulator, lead/cadmium/zinc/bismuth-responsive transcriptional repressor